MNVLSNYTHRERSTVQDLVIVLAYNTHSGIRATTSPLFQMQCSQKLSEYILSFGHLGFKLGGVLASQYASTPSFSRNGCASE